MRRPLFARQLNLILVETVDEVLAAAIEQPLPPVAPRRKKRLPGRTARPRRTNRARR